MFGREDFTLYFHFLNAGLLIEWCTITLWFTQLKDLLFPPLFLRFVSNLFINSICYSNHHVLAAWPTFSLHLTYYSFYLCLCVPDSVT